MLDKRQIFGGVLRGALSVGSLLRLLNWAAQKPDVRAIDIHTHYRAVPDDVPASVWTLILRDKSGPSEKVFEGESYEQVIIEATVWVSK